MVKKKVGILSNESQDDLTTEKVNVISNCLLGKYAGKEYVISSEIKDELIEAKKLKKSVFKNSVFCSAFLQNYGELLFELTFQKNTVKNLAMAELYVLENEYKVNGYIQNTIRTKVGEYVDELENFIEKAYKHFHILLTENGGRDYNLDEDISIEAYIGAKRNYNVNMAKLTQKKYNALYKDYVTKRLELLKKLNLPYTQAILEKFNEEYAKIEKYFLEDGNYKSVSELLDKCIQDCSGINPDFAEQEKQVKEQMNPLVDDFKQQANEIEQAAHPKAMDSLNRQDQSRMEEMERDMMGGGQKQPEPVKENPKREANTASSNNKKEPTKETTKKKPSSAAATLETIRGMRSGDSASYDYDYSEETTARRAPSRTGAGKTNAEASSSKGTGNPSRKQGDEGPTAETPTNPFAASVDAPKVNLREEETPGSVIDGAGVPYKTSETPLIPSLIPEGRDGP